MRIPKLKLQIRSERIYERHKKLINYYVSRIDLRDCVYERDDLKQELSIKLLEVCRMYVKRVDEYIKGDASKPTPVDIYIKTALSNFIKTFGVNLSKENKVITNIERYSLDLSYNDGSLDLGNDDYNVNGVEISQGLAGIDREIYKLYLDKGNNVYNVNGIDVLQGLIGFDREIYKLYLDKMSMTDILKLFPSIKKKHLNSIINLQRSKLEVFREDLFDMPRSTVVFSEIEE